MDERKRIFSGMRPTGRLHYGHMAGALINWVKLQNEYNCFWGIVDWHAMMSDYADPSKVKENCYEILLDWLAVGVDPEKSSIFIQSHVKQHAEIHLALSMITPLGWLQRCPTYKEQILNLQNKDLSTYAFLGYPVLMAGDILLYKSWGVPVGEDQSAHLELTREVARRFNGFYGEVFPEPETLLTPAAKMPGTDGRKMSKSYGNSLQIAEDMETIWGKVRTMMTDPARERRTEIHEGCLNAGIGCVDCKKKLMAHLTEMMDPIQKRRAELAKRPDDLKQILETGAARARKVAEGTMENVYSAMNLIH